jgi:cell division septal protein FtsQ
VRLSGGGQKTNTFQYSSNRAATERGFDRGGAERRQAYARKIKERLMRIPYVVGFICLGLGVFYLSTLSTNPQLVIMGDQQLIRDKDAYRQTAQQILASKLQYRSKISLNGQDVADQLQNSFPELKMVDVSTPLFRHRPVFELAVSSPALIFVSGNDTYLLDERGVALFNMNRTDHKVDTAKLPVLSDQSNFAIEVNKPALSGAQIGFVDEVSRQLAAKKLEISSMELRSGGGELDMRLKDIPYKVRFNFYEDGRKSAGAFLAAKEQVEREGAKPAEYIDLRIPSRAYVR